MRVTLLVLLTVLASCAPRAAQVDSTAVSDTSTAAAVGTVRVVGSEPVNVQTVVQTEDGRSLEVRGNLQPEIRQLSGAVVAVYGPIEGSVIEATGYEIRSVDGQPVIMGEIIRIDDGWAQLRTSNGRLIFLGSVPPDFRVGQKVWVQGQDALLVQSYGRISG